MPDSEFRSYAYIRQSLEDLGWDARNPRRGGSVYTQGEFRNHDELLTTTLGQSAPENIVLIPGPGGFHYWIIEAKAATNDLQIAIGEAQDYADSVNRAGEPRVRFISGVAGTPDQSIYIETRYWDGRTWEAVSINSYNSTGFLTPEQCRRILDRNDAKADYFDDDSERFLRKSQAINKTLHANEVPIGERAKTLAALLLALAYDGNLPVHETASRMVRDVNGCILDFLNQHGKGNFAPAIRLVEPISKSNHNKYRRAIVETLQHLREMNIRSAINSGDDSLGKFYETFLKYANGAKEMGIVLTPRHITKFAVDVLGVGPEDTVFDPACGTGGFLVAAMDAMRKVLGPSQYNDFKDDHLFGVEQRDDVYGLALVNMIFRGDGKSHIENGNCFDYDFWRRDDQTFHTPKPEGPLDGGTRPFSKVLLNPPFKLDETAEWEFVDYGLSQTKPGGQLFAILPHVVVEGNSNQAWRKELLRRHTLKAVVKLDKNLFYPITESTYAVIIEAHTPHKTDDVFMGVLLDDNHRPRRSKLLSAYVQVDNVDHMTDLLKRHMLGRPLTPDESSKPRELILAKIRADTFAPEAYFNIVSPSTRPDTSSRLASLNAAKHNVQARTRQREDKQSVMELYLFNVLDLIEEVIEPPLQTLKFEEPGDIPIVSATSKDNGIGGYRSVAPNLRLRDCITISRIHNTKPCEAFWHPYEFSALAGKVYILKPKPEWAENESAILYLCQAITDENAWRYDYARQVKLDELKAHLPISISRWGEIDFEAMNNND